MSKTEELDPRFADIDTWPTVSAVNAMLDGQVAAIASIKGQTGTIADAADAAADRLKVGGRIAYAGAGTSGRVAIQDGVELGPTFGWPETRLVYLMAGGMEALAHSAEGAEDDGDAARAAVLAHGIGANDVLIGVAASGRTPFTIAAIETAGAAGALTIGIANNPDSALLAAADHGVLADTGSELIAGSTRMKAGTAQKAVLNLLSTAIMLRLGRVYRGLMVDMVISNEKLLHRAQGIVRTLTNCSDSVAIAAVETAHHNIKAAVLIALGKSAKDAAALLDRHDGTLRDAIDALKVRP
jgi:N-acetylmuramic acid 6-phosphate etherase